MENGSVHEPSRLASALIAARTFEEAAAAVLEPALRVAEDALAASRFASKGRLLRAMVHLRPGDGYRGIAVLDRTAKPSGQAGVSDGAEGAAYLPSAGAWRWVSEHRAAVAIDVNMGRVEAAAPTDAPSVRLERSQAASPVLGRESAARLLERASTHLYAVPLHTPAGIVGMIAIEAECRAAMGRPFIWDACAPALHHLAFVAAPYLASRPLALQSEGAETDELLPVVGAKARGLVRMARVFAQQDETLLISGPTGAGKSRFARYCHARSRRREGPFEVVDLLSIPDELQMGELFGWKKGAFSGAAADNAGSIARAERGTLFIDEIDKLTLKAQAGLLHVLEERRYRPLGEGSGERKADLRFIVGTNANLEEAVKAGRLREDLYYRVNVLPLRLVPLDERADEIALWAEYMVGRRQKEGPSGGRARIARAAVALLEGRRWPGNLRQLDNVIRRAYALALVERGEASGDVVIEEADVARALGYETGNKGAEALPDVLVRAAEAFVREAERRAEAGASLDLDLAEALRGFVLGTAVRRLGGEEKALRLLGKGAAVEHRNHKKMFRREMERVAELYRALGSGERSPFEGLIDEE